MTTETNLAKLAGEAVIKEEENFYFKGFLANQNGEDVDKAVHSLNNEVTPLIDCTACGNCCKSLMINVEEPEAENVAAHLKMDIAAFKHKYIETSQGGMMVVNTIPCHFLTGTLCSVYEHRFDDCREFPGLHRHNFKGRLFATFMHYGRCPIVYNVVEALKVKLGFAKPV